MLKAWIRDTNTTYIMNPSQQVVMRKPKGIPYPPHAICQEGFSLLTARAGSVSLCFKKHKAQTFRLLAPGCEDALSGLDPANTSRLQLEGHTDEKCYREEGRTLSTYRKTRDKNTYWKKYVPRSSIDKLCEGTKKNGQPCQKLAEPGGRYCSLHRSLK